MAEKQTHELLSELTDHEANVYDLTRSLARVAKQIKADTKEDIEPPAPVLEAIDKVHEFEQL